MPQHRDPTVQLVDEQKFGKVCVEVLAHRLKNKIATAMIRSSVPIMRAGDQHSQLRLAANIVPGISLRVVARSLSVYVESKTDLFVKRSSYRIVTIQMQKKHLGASDDMADECTNQRGCINTLAVTWVSTHGRNLWETIKPHSLARHGDEIVRVANAEVSAKYDHPCREGPGLCQFDQVQQITQNLPRKRRPPRKCCAPSLVRRTICGPYSNHR